MKSLITIISLIALLLSCKEAPHVTRVHGFREDIKRTCIQPESYSHGIFTDFPGGLFVDDSLIYLHNPRATNYSVQLYDATTLEELGKILKKGRGPDEVIDPSVFQTTQNGLFFIDENSRKEGVFRVRNSHKEYGEFVFFRNRLHDTIDFGIGPPHSLFPATVFINDSTMIMFVNESGEPYLLVSPGSVEEFGQNFPEVTKNRGLLIGSCLYSSERELFIRTARNFPYISIYGRRGGSFILESEFRGFDELSVSSDGEPLFDSSQRAIWDCTLTRDYIVGTQRDYENVSIDDSKGVGVDWSKLPQTVFIYSYEGELLTIADLGSPIIRIAGRESDNVLYAIVYDEDHYFSLVRYEL